MQYQFGVIRLTFSRLLKYVDRIPICIPIIKSIYELVNGKFNIICMICLNSIGNATIRHSLIVEHRNLNTVIDRSNHWFTCISLFLRYWPTKHRGCHGCVFIYAIDEEQN